MFILLEPLIPWLAAFLRQAFLFALTSLGGFIAEKVLSPAIEGAISTLKSKFGLSDEDATIIIANQILEWSAFLLGGALVMKTKLPLKVLDRLGYSRFGLTKRSVSIEAEAKLSKAAADKTFTTGSIAAQTEAAAEAIATKGSATKETIKAGLSTLMKVTNSAFLYVMVLANVIDFGNWNGGAYQKTMQKFIATVSFGTLTPDSHFPNASQISNDLWNKIYNFFKIRGAVGITDTVKGVDYPFTAANLADVVDRLAVTMETNGDKPTFNNVIALIGASIIYLSGNPVEPAVETTTTTQTTTTQVPPATTSGTKVFTGVIANGILGAPQTFKSTTDGYIDNDADLKETAAQTLANYIMTLPAQFHFEIGIVNTWRSVGGFTQKGEAVRLQTGVYKNGTPKYKTIYKKFAVLKVYLYDEHGRKVMMMQENLGQVNATDYTPSPSTLSGISASLTPDTFSTSLNDITHIAQPTTTITSAASTSQPAPASSPAPVTVPIATVQYSAPIGPVQVATPTPSIAKSLPLNEAAAVPFSYGSMGSTSAAEIAVKQGVSLDALNAVNQNWWQGRPLSSYGSMDISTMMRNYSVPPVNIPSGGTTQTTAFKTNTGISGLNVRATASTSATIIDSLTNGTPVTVIGAGGFADGYSWLQISYTIGGSTKTGYVADQYLIRI